MAHVATWEGEAVNALPIIMHGKRPPRYGGVDGFNARQNAANSRPQPAPRPVTLLLA